MTLPNRSHPSDWPELPFAAWSDTAATLHMWTQIVGKIRLVQSPWTTQSWHVALYVTARGLGTSPIAHGGRVFDMELDFVDHRLAIRTADGAQRDVALRPRTVADFYGEVCESLRALRLDVPIHTTPS